VSDKVWEIADIVRLVQEREQSEQEQNGVSIRYLEAGQH
jgi:hypothetical protein